jgi:hypothetical protein
VDQKGNILTEVVVKKSLKDTVYKNLSMYKYITYIKEFIKESMEIKKPVTKYFQDNSFAVTAIPFFFGEKKIGAWFLIGTNNNKAIEKENNEELRFLSEAKNINRKSYDKIMLFLWSYVKGICNTIVGNLDLIEEKKDLKEKSLKYEKQLEKTKMITKILQLANLERPYVEVLNNIFNNVVSFCDFEKVIIYESNEIENQIMIQYEWHLGEGMPKGRKNRQIADKMPYIHNVLQGKGGFVQLYEMDNNEEFNELFQNTKVSAAAIAQLTLNYFNDSIIIFTNSKENNRWKDYELSLFREILPIIQNVFVKAREAERFLHNKNTLFEMLNNLDSIIFVISKENSEVLYVNKLAITNFGKELIGIPFFEVCNNLRIDLYQNFRDVREFCSLEGNYKCYEQGRNRHLLIQSKEIQWFDGQNALAIYIKDMNEALFQLKNEFSFLFNEK